MKKEFKITAKHNAKGGIDVTTKSTEMSTVEILAVIAVVRHELITIVQDLVNEKMDK